MHTVTFFGHSVLIIGISRLLYREEVRILCMQLFFLRFVLSADVVVFLTTVPREGFSGLKPSTLKQLGQTVTTTTAKQVNTHTNT